MYNDHNSQVYKAKEVETGVYYALKRIKMENEKEGVSQMLIMFHSSL